MKFVPRFLSEGSAVACGGYVHRVRDNVIRQSIPVPSASTSLGGASESVMGPYSFVDETGSADPVVSFGASSIKAWHTQEREDSRDGQTHTTHARATVEDVSVDKRLFIDRARAYLKAVHRAGEAQPTITPVEAHLEGLVIDGVHFKVTLDSEPAKTFDTCTKFQRACAKNSRFAKTHAHRFLSLRKGASNTRRSAKDGYIACSLVERIEWDGPLPAGAEVDAESHVIVWPNFGKIILGEMLISDFSRRLTMVRLELGSPVEGSMAFADIQSGGQGLP